MKKCIKEINKSTIKKLKRKITNLIYIMTLLNKMNNSFKIKRFKDKMINF